VWASPVVGQEPAAGCCNDGWDGHVNKEDNFTKDENCERANPEACNQQMHSVVVHGWGGQNGADGIVNFYLITSSAVEREEAEETETRITECAVKMFVIPTDISEELIESSEAAQPGCAKPADFCTGESDGYTDAEDCDGDDKLDHYCWRQSDVEGEDAYEAFTSSKANCEVVEAKCRRRVLPGAHEGCQRPLGWCMQGDVTYRRDQDCDGDGNYDHICETSPDGHNGFISSASSEPVCKDMWTEGENGQACALGHSGRAGDLAHSGRAGDLASEENCAPEDLPHFKLVKGTSCVQHVNPRCFQSGKDYPHGSDEDEEGSEEEGSEEEGSEEEGSEDEGCELEVEWDAEKEGECSGESGERELHLDVRALDIVETKFESDGKHLGDVFTAGALKLTLGKDVVVEAGETVTWKPEGFPRRGGWLICLTSVLKSEEETLKPACDATGDSLWRDSHRKSDGKAVQVECSDDCGEPEEKEPVDDDDKFLRTANVCNAGYEKKRSRSFSVTFTTDEEGHTVSFEVE